MAQENMLTEREIALKAAFESLGMHGMIVIGADGVVEFDQHKVNAYLVANGIAALSDAEAIAMKEKVEFEYAQAQKIEAEAELAKDQAEADEIATSIIPAGAANIEALQIKLVELQAQLGISKDKVSARVEGAVAAQEALAAAQAVHDEAQMHLAEERAEYDAIQASVEGVNTDLIAAKEKYAADERALVDLHEELASGAKDVAAAEAAVIKEGAEAVEADARVVELQADLAKAQASLALDEAAIAAAEEDAPVAEAPVDPEIVPETDAPVTEAPVEEVAVDDEPDLPPAPLPPVADAVAVAGADANVFNG